MKPIEARDYQNKFISDIYDGWRAKHKILMAVLATGLGKTVGFSLITRAFWKRKYRIIIIVHRKELLEQISNTVGQFLKHNIMCGDADLADILSAQTVDFGRDFYDPHSLVTIATVQTLNSSKGKAMPPEWYAGFDLWITDEAAHVLRENMWGKVLSQFTKARGLGVTATPCRLDGKGFDTSKNMFEKLIVGPDNRWGIANGYLSKYVVMAPEAKVLGHLKRKSGKDYSVRELKEAAGKVDLIGDVVKTHFERAKLLQSIVYTTDINSAEVMATNFKAMGYAAEAVSSKTPRDLRRSYIRSFRNRDITVLINVDLFDEGFDVPGVECIVLARATASFGKYRQMVGRGLRKQGDKKTLIIDHVGAIASHGLPCQRVEWSLEGSKTSPKPVDEIKIRTCLNPKCLMVYDGKLDVCPFCKTERMVTIKSPPKWMNGAFVTLDPEDPESIARYFKKTTGSQVFHGFLKAGYTKQFCYTARHKRNELLKKREKLIAQVGVWCKGRDKWAEGDFKDEFGVTIEEAVSKSGNFMVELGGRVEAKNRESGHQHGDA